MMRSVKWKRDGLVVGLAVVLLAVTASAALDDFKLARAIPADASVAVVSRDHAGRAFLKQQYQRVWEAVERQGFDKDLRTLLKGIAEKQGQDLTEFEQQWQQFRDLLVGVEWGTLAEQEGGFAMKLTFPVPEMVVMGLSSPDKARANFAGLEAILKKLLSFAPEGALTLGTQGQGDSVVHVVSPVDAMVPLSLTLAREKDVLLVGLGQTLPEQTLGLLRGEPGKKLVASERFQAALKRLPPPTDEFAYVDVSLFMGQLRSVVEAGVQMGGEIDQTTDPKLRALPGKFIDCFDMFDYFASTAATDGMKTTSETLTVLRTDARGRPLYAVLCGNGTLKEPLKFVPQNALNFSAWSGINLTALHDAVLAFIRDEVPNGDALLENWEQTKAELKAQANLEIEADLLSWIGGGITSFRIPGRSAYSPPQSVFLFNVKDEAKAREMLDRLLAAIEPFLAAQKGVISDADIPGGEGFKVIMHPMLAMIPGLGQPTVGVNNGHLFLGSSPRAVAAALATAAGEAPNFSTNERFQKEGAPLAANVMAASFTDLTKQGEEWGQLLSMVPMIGMFAPQVTQDPAGRALLSVAGKLGKVAQEWNFTQSSFSQTTFDGQIMHTKTITNYREPPKKPTATPEAKEPGAGGTENAKPEPEK